jgi:3-hydroxy acid dehydrogenase / malonic semialdehyde reductase
MRALITGASAGIGWATALELAPMVEVLVLTGRRSDRLLALKEEIESNHSVEVLPLVFDVSRREEVSEILAQHRGVLEGLNVLVNNAGLALGTAPMDEGALDDWETMVDTNIKGLLYMTRSLIPFLKHNRPSHIVNLGSVAGRWTYPGGGVYCATKFAVRAITEGLRMDLSGQGIRVTNISPGMVETEFSEVRFGDKDKARGVYSGMTPLSAQDIARCISWCLSQPEHVNVQELVIYPTDQASVGLVHRD